MGGWVGVYMCVTCGCVLLCSNDVYVTIMNLNGRGPCCTEMPTTLELLTSQSRTMTSHILCSWICLLLAPPFPTSLI